ncbi:MAG: SurA N-terminal domain-containing protein [Chloroflexi bacterium]|nr:SurA N-terminal domain-containing protein [Chloroflexota bacterium]
MARRERTTALPKHRPRQRSASGRVIAGFRIEDRHIRYGILGAAAALLVLVVSVLAWGVYSDRYRKPNETVVQVGGQEASLRYFTDRLLAFAQANTGSSVTLIEQGLLNKLAEEFLTIEVARGRGIDLSDDAVTLAIADDLGVPVGGSGSAFDNLYRQRVKALAMSAGNYRRLITAQLADSKLREQLQAELTDKGEAITVRMIVVAQKDLADKLVERIKAGENMGTIAQTESIDFETKSEDGIRPPAPPELYPQAIRDAMAGKADGELIGPILVDGNYWILRVDKRDKEFTYTAAQKNDLISVRFAALLKQQRIATPPKISFDSSDAKWAESHVGEAPAVTGN